MFCAVISAQCLMTSICVLSRETREEGYGNAVDDEEIAGFVTDEVEAGGTPATAGPRS